jgi:nicotinamide-nucleotide amidase
MSETSTKPSQEILVELITIGREILDGRVVDTNSIVMAETLRSQGLVVRFAQKVDDSIDRIVDAFTIANGRADYVIVSGGLGPTADDLTAEAMAQFLASPLEQNPSVLDHLKEFFSKRGAVLTPTQEKQTYFPQSAEILPNTVGTAAGFTVKASRAQFFVLPGVPIEMQPMLVNEVLPRLPRKEGYRSQSWATQFTSEGGLQDALAPVYKDLPEGFEITYRTRFPENHIGLHGWCFDSRRDYAFQKLTVEIENILVNYNMFAKTQNSGVFETLQSLEQVVVEALVDCEGVVVTVESCTGGQVATRLTEVAGSSKVFWGSFVTYDNSAKTQLGVLADDLIQHGAVSQVVAESLASCALERLKNSVESEAFKYISKPRYLFSVSTTGIAGPGGGTEKKPVGLCHIALAVYDLNAKTQVILHEEVRGRSGLDRRRLRELFSQRALNLILQQTKKYASR